MKNTVLITFLLLAGSLCAGIFESKRLSFVHVISDQADASVPAGKCVITGVVYYEEVAGPDMYVNKRCDSIVSAIYRIGEGQQQQVRNDGSFRVTVDTLEKYMSFMASGWQNDLFETIYLEHYPFKSGHRIELAVYLPLRARQVTIEVDKPVIYAYSDKALEFSLELQARGELSFTYPSLPANNTWDMKIDASGHMSDLKGNVYPYLFWESRQQLQSFALASPGSDEIVDKDGLLAYLESSLTALGLNQQEKTDFITYWCPKMLGHNFVRVQFFMDEQCAVIGNLEINPKPDAVRRVYALFTGIDKLSLDFEPLPLKPSAFKREGFVILEWGGSEFRSNEL